MDSRIQYKQTGSTPSGNRTANSVLHSVGESELGSVEGCSRGETCERGEVSEDKWEVTNVRDVLFSRGARRMERISIRRRSATGW